jgi:hypothetical protein
MKIFIEDQNGNKVRVYTIRDAEQLVPYSESYLRTMADTGKIPAWKIGRDWFITLPGSN